MKHVRIEGGSFRFSGECPSCWNVCHAVCCRTAEVPLSEEEIASRQYRTQKRQGLTILARTEEGCVYLKGNKCSIYERRPVVCRRFDCSKHLWRMLPADMLRTSEPASLPKQEIQWDGMTHHYPAIKWSGRKRK